jgi:hypothetical protein
VLLAIHRLAQSLSLEKAQAHLVGPVLRLNSSMDVPRSPEVAKRKKAKRILFSVATLIVVVFVTVVLAKLKPAAPYR